MNLQSTTLKGYLVDHRIEVILYIVLAFLFIKTILERRTFLGSDMKKMYIMQGISIVVACFLNLLMYLIFKADYLVMGMNFYVITVPIIFYNLILFSVVTFELIYDFYYLQTKISLHSLYPYAILYGFIIGSFIVYDTINFSAIGIVFIVANIMYYGYLIKVIDSKGNIIRY